MEGATSSRTSLEGSTTRQPLPIVVVSLPIEVPHPQHPDLGNQFALLLTNESVKNAMLPTFLGYPPEDETSLDNALVRAFSQSWTEFLQHFPRVSFTGMGPHVYGKTTQANDSACSSISINFKLVEQYLDGLRLAGLGHDPHRLKADQYFMLIMSTFVHESAHAFGFFIRKYGTPYKLHFANYVRKLSEIAADAEWVWVQAAGGVGDEDREDFIKSPEGAEVLFTMGEAGYVAERCVFGGVVGGFERLPATPVPGQTTAGSDDPVNIDEIEGICIDLYNKDQPYDASRGVLVKVDSGYLGELERMIARRQSLLLRDHPSASPLNQLDPSRIRYRTRHCADSQPSRAPSPDRMSDPQTVIRMIPRVCPYQPRPPGFVPGILRIRDRRPELP